MTTTLTPTSSATSIIPGMKASFEGITQPGCWINNSTGHLIRVSEDFDASTWSGWFSCEGTETWWWTFLNEDPSWSTENCREAAAEWGITTSF